MWECNYAHDITDHFGVYSAKYQRKLTNAIKVSRIMALLPFIVEDK